MLADGPIEIEFPSLTGSGEQTTRAEIAPPPESEDADGDGDDFAWLAAAFADDDDVADADVEAYADVAVDPNGQVDAEVDADADPEGHAFGDAEFDEPDELPSEDLADLWERVDGEPDSIGAPSNPEEPAGRSLAGAEPLPALEDEPRSPLISATASDENDPGGLLLGTIPALRTAIAGRRSESPPGESAVDETRRDLEADEVSERAVGAEGTPKPGTTGRQELDAEEAEEEAPAAALELLDDADEDPDPAVEEPVDITPKAAPLEEPEEATAPDLPIEAIRRRPGFREELLAAFGQIYKR